MVIYILGKTVDIWLEKHCGVEVTEMVSKPMFNDDWLKMEANIFSGDQDSLGFDEWLPIFLSGLLCVLIPFIFELGHWNRF